jgi:hypothetical protein
MLSTYKMEMIYDADTQNQFSGTVVTKALNKKQAKTFAINEGIRKYNPNGDSIGIEKIYKLEMVSTPIRHGKNFQYWKELKIK